MGCKLAEELASGFGLRATASEHCVDVLSDGFAFRLFLSSDRCGHLMRASQSMGLSDHNIALWRTLRGSPSDIKMLLTKDGGDLLASQAIHTARQDVVLPLE